MRPLRLFLLPLFLGLILGGCATASPPREASEALPANESAFGRSVQAEVAQHQGLSGFRLLASSNEAFRARAELIRKAQKSLDLQYYIVHDGLSTRLLVHEMLLAADRGVRVRILLDDTASDDQEEVIATLAVHPNVSIRVFNPLHLGRSTGVTRSMGRLFNLSQQHRRMHNKLWLADNSMAIVGGRNLGDAYFDAEPNLNFTDIDLLCAGPVAEQLGHSFDQYWNSALSRPIADFQLNDWRDELIWAHGQALWDAPSKVLADGEPDPALLLTTQLEPELKGVNQELMLISAYFVPRDTGLVYLTSHADAGVAIFLLTNSLDATDVPAVHGGYMPYRKALLEHGVKLYEMRRQAGDPSAGSSSGSGSGAGSESSLHSKAIIFDKQKVFIGSFNFDPRSLLWNTEVGVLVDSPELAGYTRKLALEGMAPAISYEARLEHGQMVWVTEDNGHLHTVRTEPGGLWRRFNAWMSRTIGLEKML